MPFLQQVLKNSLLCIVHHSKGPSQVKEVRAARAVKAKERVKVARAVKEVRAARAVKAKERVKVVARAVKEVKAPATRVTADLATLVMGGPVTRVTVDPATPVMGDPATRMGPSTTLEDLATLVDQATPSPVKEVRAARVAKAKERVKVEASPVREVRAVKEVKAKERAKVEVRAAKEAKDLATRVHRDIRARLVTPVHRATPSQVKAAKAKERVSFETLRIHSCAIDAQ
jgi:hypothetical protein